MRVWWSSMRTTTVPWSWPLASMRLRRSSALASRWPSPSLSANTKPGFSRRQSHFGDCAGSHWISHVPSGQSNPRCQRLAVRQNAATLLPHPGSAGVHRRPEHHGSRTPLPVLQEAPQGGTGNGATGFAAAMTSGAVSAGGMLGPQPREVASAALRNFVPVLDLCDHARPAFAPPTRERPSPCRQDAPGLRRTRSRLSLREPSVNCVDPSGGRPYKSTATAAPEKDTP